MYPHESAIHPTGFPAASPGDLDAVRRKRNHDPAHVATTLVYALSDQLTPEELKSMAPAKRRGRKE